jgi:hypothetical protein
LLVTAFLLRRITGLITEEWMLIMTVITSAFVMIRYTIIAMIAIDRVMVLKFPFTYSRIAGSFNVKVVSVLIWVIVFGLCVVPFIFICDFSAVTSDIGGQYLCFVNISPLVHIPFLGPCLLIACVSFPIIVNTVYKQTRGKNIRTLISLYKITFASLANVLNCLVTFAIYIIILLFVDMVYDTLIIMESMMYSTALIDATIYILWLKEVRLELLKMAALFCPKLEMHVQRLRYNIFDIIVYNDLSNTRASFT